jgi:hypothetical protein
MNRFLLTSAMALTALALGQQHASAWHEFNMCGSFNISCRGGGHHWSISGGSDSYPGCPAPYCAAGSYWQTQTAPPPPAHIPPPTPVQKTGYEGWNNGGIAPVGYYAYPQAGYGFYQAPSYWYGR